MKAFTLINKKLLLVVTFLCTFFLGFTQTTLFAGDIAITGYRSDWPDEFTFVLLTDVQATTQIKFTDNGWQTSGSFRPGEGVLIWTATTDLSCGTEVNVAYSNPIFVASEGTITNYDNFGLEAIDQILAYQGNDNAPTFLYAIHFSGSSWSNSTNDQSTAIPSGLTDGINAVYLGYSQNGNYDCSITVDPALILSAVSISSNWITSNDPIPLGGCIYGCYSCVSSVTWDGSIWIPATGPNISTEVIIDDVYDTSAQSSFEACSLTVTVNGSLRVSDGDYITVENDIITNGTFIVNEQGSVVQLDDNANVIGSATVRKETAEMWQYYEYTYWSSPVSGETIGNALAQSDPTRRFRFEAGNFKDSTMESNNDGSQDPGQDDIDDDGDDWQPISAAAAMTPGVGYASHHEESIFFLPPPETLPYQFTYIFDGPFNNGVIPVTVRRNVPVPPETEEFDDYNWNLIGNPYPSAIDVDIFFAENNYDGVTFLNGNLTGAVYLWSQDSPPAGTNNGNENQNFVNSDYAIINGVGATGATYDGGDGLIPSRYIPSGQGFFVAYSDLLGAASGNVVFNNSMRVTGNNNQFFRDFVPNDNKFYLNLTSENGIFNQTLIGYKEGATNQLDEMYYDAPRNLSSGASAIIYSVIEDSDRKFAIQGRNIISLNSNDVIPIGIKNTIEGQTEFTISVAQVEGGFLNGTDIILKDNLLNIEHYLSDSGYTFILDTGEFNSRFEIVYASTLSISETNEGFDELIVNSDNNYLNISTSQQSGINRIKLYDLMGRQLIDQDIDNRFEVRLNANSLTNSVFILDITLSNGVKLTKKFINI